MRDNIARIWPAAAPRAARGLFRLVAVAAGFLLIGVCGCGRATPRLTAPVIDATRAGREAIVEYDTNGDGAISDTELDQCPGLRAALKLYGAGTGRITAGDITERIGKWQENRVCMSQMPIRLTLDGKPLVGATVTADPEKFLGSAIPAATGVTNDNGIAWPQVGQGRPGVFYGLYKLRVSKQVDGREIIPARYNSHTELGFEKAPDAPSLTGLTLALKSP